MGYSYADLSDTPYVAPAKVEPLSVGRGQMKELEQRFPDLTRKLRAAAIQAEASMGGPITSADVWAILDPETAAQAKGIAQGRIMSSAFDTGDWEQTGRFLKKGSRGRPISEWRRKTRVAA
jgi:hypothetical protein